MRKLYYKLCDFLERRRDRKFDKQLNSEYNAAMQLLLTLEHSNKEF